MQFTACSDCTKGTQSVRDAVLAFFRNELNILKSLRHDGIIGILDYGIDSEYPFIVMDLMDQGSLADIVQLRGYLDVDEVLGFLLTLADALDFAHSKNIVHRDIKPSNILFDRNGKPALTDFGVSRVISPLEDYTGGRTRPGPTVGTADFMAPEVLDEAPQTMNSDIYSLGLVVYFALSGHLPSKAGTLFARCRDRVEGRLITLSQRNPIITRAVSDAVMKSIATDPVERYSTALEFWSSLHAASKDLGSLSRNRSSDARLMKDPVENKLDYLRYVWVPVLLALIGIIGTIATSLIAK